MNVLTIIDEINLMDKQQIEIIYNYLDELTSKGKIFKSDNIMDTVENRVANYKDDLTRRVNVHTNDSA